MPSVVYVLPRGAAQTYLREYTNYLTGMIDQRNITSRQSVTPPDAFLQSLAETLHLGPTGLDATQLPVVVAGRAGDDFEEACAELSYTDGCIAATGLAVCSAGLSTVRSALVPCADGQRECYSSKQKLPPKEALRLYQMVHLTSLLFEQHGIWHFAAGSTHLGAVRNKGIIPHDDDSDLNILRSQKAKLLNLAFAADLSKNSLYLKKVHDDFWQVTDKEMPHLHTDIFAMVVIDGRLTYDHGYWPGTHFPLSIMEPGGLVLWPFGSSAVWAPNRTESEAHLSRKYGPNWKNEISCKNTYHACSGVVDVQYDLHNHAEPSSPVHDPVLSTWSAG
eukprot:gnl/TRDRNA2_/TRDRNA2_92624_c0_seq1.p1 gnl/TRDRNA2_/TRDRNA2_92624_c0~~gnl/TRDRNA2_/TRDRNA2_92624_c0_seq1.p1  ORF type:complete len:373 (-),score=47.83 gnl/TRDRNA2_/TRDRNA2_92624_c0_seq1:108-1106(-)